MEPEYKKILVVEDDAPLRRVLVEKLTGERFNVLEAADGQEGVVIALRDRPDLIILDVYMPKMDGISMLTKLRSDPWGRSASVLVLTNSTDAETIAKVTGLGAADFLIKSEWSLANLVERIRKEIKYRAGEQETAWVNPALG